MKVSRKFEYEGLKDDRRVENEGERGRGRQKRREGGKE